ncbi:unnamed protein product, partial [Amoebophrya sp. A120]|eukprot:GSA120T00009928001.1
MSLAARSFLIAGACAPLQGPHQVVSAHKHNGRHAVPVVPRPLKQGQSSMSSLNQHVRPSGKKAFLQKVFAKKEKKVGCSGDSTDSSGASSNSTTTDTRDHAGGSSHGGTGSTAGAGAEEPPREPSSGAPADGEGSAGGGGDRQSTACRQLADKDACNAATEQKCAWSDQPLKMDPANYGSWKWDFDAKQCMDCAALEQKYDPVNMGCVRARVRWRVPVQCRRQHMHTGGRQLD